MTMLILLTLASLLAPCLGARVLQFAPGMSGSHILFNFRLAETLTSFGHNVTLWNVVNTTETVKGNFVPPKGVREFRFQADIARKFGPNARQELVKSLNQALFSGLNRENLAAVNSGFNDLIFEACAQLLDETEELEKMRGKVDILLSHPFDYCPFVVAYELNVTKLVFVMPGTFMIQNVEQIFGLPSAPSYQPNFLALASDRMSFAERTKSLLWWLAMTAAEFQPSNPRNREAAMFRAPPDQSRPSIAEWIRQHSALLLINGEANLDFPRPFHHSVLFLGDLAGGKAKTLEKTGAKLSPEWEKEMAKGTKGVILFSLGTVANTTLMPVQMKLEILGAFARFPDYHIVWRIDGGVPGVDVHKHITVVNWVPQKDLLRHPRLRLFITHGGYNSLLESSKARVPLLLLPLMGDQYCNAMRAVRHGFGLYMDKFGFSSESMAEDMRALIDNPEFANKASKLGKTLDDKIVPSSVELHHKLGQLMRLGDGYPTLRRPRAMSFAAYFGADVAGMVLALVGVPLMVLQRLLGRSWRKAVPSALLVSLATPFAYVALHSHIAWMRHQEL